MNTLRPELEKLVGDDPEGMKVGIILAMAMLHGQDVDHLAALTGIDREFISTVSSRMIKNRIWENGEVGFEKSPHEDLAHWNVEFTLHIMVGQGVVEKVFG